MNTRFNTSQKVAGIDYHRLAQGKEKEEPAGGDEEYRDPARAPMRGMGRAGERSSARPDDGPRRKA